MRLTPTVINGGCTPNEKVYVDYEENSNGLPITWIKTGDKQGVHAPLTKEAVRKLIEVLIDNYGQM